MFYIKTLLFQNLEAELSKKCDELRQLFLLQQSQQQHASEDTNSTATPSPPTSTTSVLRALRKPSGESKYRRSQVPLNMKFILASSFCIHTYIRLPCNFVS